ncbi:unnamed protein product [Rhizoctonia solani]|uniref:Uncharacterized protein n=1 Tax=Rhizoctonia solani TaxID=456999 RepID=A0A8H3A165_9AGAM|nr:unnamed protein product [Rhizoctonia solani]
MEEVNQAVNQGAHTPENQPTQADIQQTPKPVGPFERQPTTLGDPLQIFAPRASYWNLPTSVQLAAPVQVKQPPSSRLSSREN